MLREEIAIETIPVGPLGIIALKGCEEMAGKVDAYLSSWRRDRDSEHKGSLALSGYEKDSYLVKAEAARFGSGEGKGIIRETVRGKDIFILVDVCNNSIQYKMSGHMNRMSPDDHFQDLKRVIGAMCGKARRITVIMPFLYESRQHRRTGRESLDCAMGLEELYAMGVENIITFDAHDPRVINCAPLAGFENVKPSYQFLKYLCKNVKGLKFDKDHMLMISPDEGAMERSVFYSSVLGINMGMFYKRRDYSVIVDGTNPIIAHEYLGQDINGKDVIIVDDMISSGGSMLDTARAVKDRGANNVFIFSTFGLFTNGMEKFDKAYEEGVFTKLLTTNLTYQSPELLERSYYVSVDMSKYVAYIIDSLNHDTSISDLLEPSKKMRSLVENYYAGKIRYEGKD